MECNATSAEPPARTPPRRIGSNARGPRGSAGASGPTGRRRPPDRQPNEANSIWASTKGVRCPHGYPSAVSPDKRRKGYTRIRPFFRAARDVNRSDRDGVPILRDRGRKKRYACTTQRCAQARACCTRQGYASGRSSMWRDPVGSWWINRDGTLWSAFATPPPSSMASRS